MTTDRTAATGCAVGIALVTLGLALVWIPLAIIVAGVLLGASMVGVAVLVALDRARSRARGPEA